MYIKGSILQQLNRVLSSLPQQLRFILSGPTSSRLHFMCQLGQSIEHVKSIQGSKQLAMSKDFYVDPSSMSSNIELGTKQYPYKALDDPFREIFNYAAQFDTTFKIYVKHGSNLTMHTNQMPLIILNSMIYLQFADTTIQFRNEDQLRTLTSFSKNIFEVQIYNIQWQLDKQQLIMTLEGANIKIENSTINVTTQNRVVIYQSQSVCSLYDYYGIANNQIWINNVFTGLNVGGYTAIIYSQNHCNFTMINNRILDIRWIYSDISITIEHINLKCPKEPYTEYIIKNNSLINRDQVRLSYIFFTLKFLEDGIQNVIISDNKFANISYYSPGLIVVQKLNMKNLKVTFTNNYFENVYNDVVETPVAVLFAPNMIVNNNTIVNSRVPTFISIKSINTIIANVQIQNVQSLDFLYGLMIDLLEPYDSSQNKSMSMNFSDWTIKDSAFEFFNLEKYAAQWEIKLDINQIVLISLAKHQDEGFVLYQQHSRYWIIFLS
eukprot:403362565